MTGSLLTWALVTDGGKARIVSLRRHPAEFHLILEIDSPTRHIPDRELTSDAPGRAHHARGSGGHAREPRKNAHDSAEQQFVDKLLQRLLRASQSGEFEALALVADPKSLGNIRGRMPKALCHKVALELNRDLTGLNQDKLEAHLRKALNWPASRG